MHPNSDLFKINLACSASGDLALHAIFVKIKRNTAFLKVLHCSWSKNRSDQTAKLGEGSSSSEVVMWVVRFDKDIRQRGTLLMIYPTTNSQATRKEWDHVMEWGGRTKPFWGLCQFALNHQALCFSDHPAPLEFTFYDRNLWIYQ